MNLVDLDRWDDRTRPTARAAGRDLLQRALAPAVLLWALILGLGFLLTDGPLRGLAGAEEGANSALAAGRTTTMNAVTKVWSTVGNTEYVIGVAVVVSLVLWWRRREWWYAVVPVLAIALQASVFVAATNLVDRPRPTVPHLDPAPPTSSFPSGHVGASTALYLTFALLAQRIESPALRRVVTGVCLLVPVLVAYARLYRGMHHVLDVLVGALNGMVCVVLAWHWLRRGGPTTP